MRYTPLFASLLLGCLPVDSSNPKLTSPSVHILDVSLLYGLPTSEAEVGLLLGATDNGRHGRLLPASFLANRRYDGHRDDHSSLRVVGVRLDPCSLRRDCQPELRLVLQPIGKPAPELGLPANQLIGHDAAFHAHYDLTDAEYDDLATAIIRARRATIGNYAADAKLGVHPGLDDLQGVFATKLNQLVLQYSGEARLGRVTEFTHDLVCDSDSWIFQISDASNGFAGSNIPVVNVPTQTSCGENFRNSSGVSHVFDQGPMLKLMPLVKVDPEPQATNETRTAAAFATDLQHPDRHDITNTDCLSCHYAEPARKIAEDNYQLTAVNAFTHRRNLGYVRNNHLVNNLHAFGYMGRDVSVMARVANESAIAADQTQQRLVD